MLLVCIPQVVMGFCLNQVSQAICYDGTQKHTGSNLQYVTEMSFIKFIETKLLSYDADVPVQYDCRIFVDYVVR